MAGRMDRKQGVDMTRMYKALKELGHKRIWLRIIGSGDRFMVTFGSRVLAAYDSSHKTWRFRKDADLVNDYPLGSVPGGVGLKELHETDERLFYLSEYETDEISRLHSYLASLDN